MSRKKKTIDDESLDAILNEAAEVSDCTFPTTVEQVKATEDKVCPPLPPHLQNPLELLDGRKEDKAVAGNVTNLVPTSEAAENLATAARNGGEVSPTIRERMDADRDRAQDDLESSNA